MLPQSRFGKISTLACPATSLPFAFAFATDGTIAASSCNSPSRSSCGYFSFAIFVASTTLSTSACFALPFVEWESIATIGFSPTSARKLLAELSAIAASSADVGSWFKPQSANKNVPFAPYSQFGTSMMKKPDTSSVPGAVFKI